MTGRPLIYNSPQELEAAIEDYFNPEGEPRDKVTITGLAYHLGFADRQSLYDYEEREAFSCIIKRARFRVEVAYEERLHENNVTGAIFALKNMGWKDKSEVDNNVTGNLTWQETKTYVTK
jgi:hypothetical protein